MRLLWAWVRRHRGDMAAGLVALAVGAAAFFMARRLFPWTPRPLVLAAGRFHGWSADAQYLAGEDYFQETGWTAQVWEVATGRVVARFPPQPEEPLPKEARQAVPEVEAAQALVERLRSERERRL